MIKTEEGTVNIEGDGLTLFADLVTIFTALTDNGFPEEALTVAMKIANEDLFDAKN